MEFGAGSGAVKVLRILWSAAVAVSVGLIWLPSLFWEWWSTECAALPLLLLPPGWWYAGRLASSLSGRTTAQAVQARYGVLWHRELFVPLTALRTFEVWTPPLHRLCGCRTVVLRFAGGAAWLPLLATADAAALTAWLEKAGEAE